MPASHPPYLVTHGARLSAIYVPAFGPMPPELPRTSLTISVTSDSAPMVKVATRCENPLDFRDRIVLVTHGAPVLVPDSDGETCDPYLFHMAQALRFGFRRNAPPTPAHLDTLAAPLVRHLAQHYARRTRERERAGLSDARLAKALAFIETKIVGALSLEDLAEAAWLSPFHFSHMFKRSTGFAPHAYLKRRRIVAAGGLLGTTSLSIAEVGRRTGHDNQAHFSVSFRRLMKMTPSHYRDLVRLGTSPPLPA